jgi:hypothetical protein
MHTITYSSHVAYLCWNVVVRDLDRRGWEPTEDELGGACHLGLTDDGREVIGLYGRSPVITVPSLCQAAEALTELARLAGLRSFTASHPVLTGVHERVGCTDRERLHQGGFES